MPFGKNEAAFIELILRNEAKLEILKKMWAVHFNEGKVIRVSHGKFDTDTLTKRSAYKAIIKDVPKVAVESALLKQMARFKAKTVYISANSNRNQRGLATIYFEIAKDLKNALKETVYYYNTKLIWTTSTKIYIADGRSEGSIVFKLNQRKETKV